MSDTDNHHLGALLEDIRDQNRAVLEAVGQMQSDIKLLATKDELQVVADDVKVIKAVLTDTNRDLTNLDSRVTRLEQAA